MSANDDTHNKTDRETTPRDAAAQRIACIDLPALGLQYATQQHEIPEEMPHILVDMSGSTPRVCACNRAAQKHGVMVGMRTAQARSACADLVVSTLDPASLNAVRQDLSTQLQRFSPWVERHPLWPDSFWVRGDGLHRLWSSASAWGRSMHNALMIKGWKAAVVVGFSRFFTLAIARQSPGHLRVFKHPHTARADALRVPLHFLLSDPKLWEEFRTLGLHTLGDLRTLPPGSVHRRYGADAAQWAQWVHAAQDIHSRAVSTPKTYTTQVAWDVPISGAMTLLFVLTQPLETLLQEMDRAGRACDAIQFELTFDWGRYVDDRLRARCRAAGVEPHENHSFEIRAAQAHVDVHRWIELLRLRLSRLRLPLGVLSVHCTARDADQNVQQERWEGVEKTRRPDALLQGLAQVRAELSKDAVGRLACVDAHLPEVRNQWTSCNALDAPAPHPRWTPVSLRRMHPKMRVLATATPEASLDAWLKQQRHAYRAIMGPYVVAGGWWERPVERAYYYVFLETGEVLWLYYDRMRKNWFSQGEVY